MKTKIKEIEAIAIAAIMVVSIFAGIMPSIVPVALALTPPAGNFTAYEQSYNVSGINIRAGSEGQFNITVGNATFFPAENITLINITVPTELTPVAATLKVKNTAGSYITVTASLPTAGGENITVNLTSNHQLNNTNNGNVSIIFNATAKTSITDLANGDYIEFTVYAADDEGTMIQPTPNIGSGLWVKQNIQKKIVINPDPASGYTNEDIQLFVNVTDVYGNVNNTGGTVNFTGVAVSGGAFVTLSLTNATSNQGGQTNTTNASMFNISDTTQESVTVSVTTNTTGITPVGATVHFVAPITAVDVYGNLSTLQADSASVVLIQAQLKAADDSDVKLSGRTVEWYLNNTLLGSLSATSSTTNADGIANVTMTAKHDTGFAKITGRTTPTTSPPTYITDSWVVQLVPKVDSTQCTVVNTTATIQANATTSTITATIKNHAGGLLDGIPVTFNVTSDVTSDTTGTVDGVKKITKNSGTDGNASVVFTSKKAPETNTINVTVVVDSAETQIGGYEQTITVNPANADHITVSPAVLVIGASSGNVLTINATIRDAEENLNITTGYSAIFSIADDSIGNLTAVDDGAITPTTVTTSTAVGTDGFITVNFTANGELASTTFIVNISGAGPTLINVTRTLEAANADGLSLTPNVTTKPIGESIELTAQLTYGVEPVAISGKSVSYIIEEGVGTLTSDEGTSDALGASTTILTSTSAGLVTVLAQSELGFYDSTTVTFSGNASSLKLTPSPETVGSGENSTITVQAVDVNGYNSSRTKTGAVITGRMVTYSITSGTGELKDADTTFDANGTASVNVTSTTAGDVTVRAIGAGVLGTTTVIVTTPGVVVKGDFDADGDIDFDDFVEFAGAYGATSCADANYNSIADFDDDCNVDFDDFVEFAGVYTG
jgi:hypothetical protein